MTNTNITNLIEELQNKILVLNNLLDDDSTYYQAKEDIDFLEKKIEQLKELELFLIEW